MIGPPEDLVVMKKGRVGGLWMNVQQVPFQNIPKVYLLWTSAKTMALETRNPEKPMKLDYLLPFRHPAEHKTGKRSFLLGELIKLKEADNLYRVFEEAIQITPLERAAGPGADAVLELAGRRTVSGGLRPGTDRLQEGKDRLVYSSTIEVRLAGLPAVVASVANQKGLWYGVLAVIIATFSGLLIGFIFPSKRGD